METAYSSPCNIHQAEGFRHEVVATNCRQHTSSTGACTRQVALKRKWFSLQQAEVAVEANLHVLHGCLSGEAESSRGHGLGARLLLPNFQYSRHLPSRCEENLLKVTGAGRWANKRSVKLADCSFAMQKSTTELLWLHTKS